MARNQQKQFRGEEALKKSFMVGRSGSTADQLQSEKAANGQRSIELDVFGYLPSEAQTTAHS